MCNEFRKKTTYKLILENVHWQGVESERCASFSQAMKAGKPVYVKAESTLADGLAVPKVGVNAFATAAPLVDKVSYWAEIGCFWIQRSIWGIYIYEKCFVMPVLLLLLLLI